VKPAAVEDLRMLKSELLYSTASNLVTCLVVPEVVTTLLPIRTDSNTVLHSLPTLWIDVTE